MIHYIYNVTLTRVAVARSQDIPYFGPEIAEGGIYDKNELFKEFLLAKGVWVCCMHFIAGCV